MAGAGRRTKALTIGQGSLPHINPILKRSQGRVMKNWQGPITHLTLGAEEPVWAVFPGPEHEKCVLAVGQFLHIRVFGLTILRSLCQGRKISVDRPRNRPGGRSP
jgi:hypothetical protein